MESITASIDGLPLVIGKGIDRRDFNFDIYITANIEKDSRESGEYKDVYCDLTEVCEWFDGGFNSEDVNDEDTIEMLKSHLDLNELLDIHGK